jgi:hypothetical protein
MYKRESERSIGNSFFFFPLYTVGKANQNEALLWKIAVLGMKNTPVGDGNVFPSPMLAFYIPSCRKCLPALRMAYYFIFCALYKVTVHCYLFLVSKC